MGEPLDVRTTKSNTYKEIYVSGKISNLGYDGARLTILHETQDFSNAMAAGQFQASKAVLDRSIECTLHLSPQTLKDWVITLSRELKNYESMFGPIMSPQEVQQKVKELKTGEDQTP